MESSRGEGLPFHIDVHSFGDTDRTWLAWNCPANLYFYFHGITWTISILVVCNESTFHVIYFLVSGRRAPVQALVREPLRCGHRGQEGEEGSS